jgi:hypothetical protein
MNYFRKICRTALILTLILLAGFGEQASAEQTSKQVDVYFVPMHFMIDGKQLAPPEDQKGFIYEGRTYVPLRFISYALNKAVQWDEQSNTVSIVEPSEQEKASIDDYKQNREVKNEKSKNVDTSNINPTGIDVYLAKVTYVFDGETKVPAEDLTGFIYQDRLYVPMRFFSESVGKKLVWDPVTYTVNAQTRISGDELPAETTGKQTVDKDSAAKPTYDELKNAADEKISALRDRAQSALFDLLIKYKATNDAQEKASLKAKGASLLAGFDAEFAAILSSFESQLTDNGYDTAIISSYQQQYNDEKQLAQSFLVK